MNHLGMMVDISHVSDNSFYQALVVSRAPVIASHSSSRAITNHARNMTDDMLVALARNGGVAQVNFNCGFISNDFLAAEKAYNLQHPEASKRARELWLSPKTPEREAELELSLIHIYALDEQVRRYEAEGKVKKYEYWEFLSAVIDGKGTCRGICAMDLRSMEVEAFEADAVIMACLLYTSRCV